MPRQTFICFGVQNNEVRRRRNMQALYYSTVNTVLTALLCFSFRTGLALKTG